MAGFLKKNKDPFYDDIKDCLKASALPFVAMLITTDFDKAYLGSPRIRIRFVQPPASATPSAVAPCRAGSFGPSASV